jgi:ABC-type sugar transport system ATPase subunit
MNQGLILRYSILDNLALPNLLQYVAKFGYFKDRKFRSNAINIMKKLKVNYRKIEDSVELLSGGNQQKVVLSKWLMKNFVLLIFDEPTVGVDVGARRHLYYLIHSLAIKGHGIIVISSDIEEMIEINPNRVMVMREGAISGFLQSEQIDRGRIFNLCYGG